MAMAAVDHRDIRTWNGYARRGHKAVGALKDFRGMVWTSSTYRPQLQLRSLPQFCYAGHLGWTWCGRHNRLNRHGACVARPRLRDVAAEAVILVGCWSHLIFCKYCRCKFSLSWFLVCGSFCSGNLFANEQHNPSAKRTLFSCFSACQIAAKLALAVFSH